MGYNPFSGGGQKTVGGNGSLLKTSANPGNKNSGGALGNWDVVGHAMDSINPYVGGAKKQDDLAAQQKAAQANQYSDTQGVMGQMDKSGNSYYDQMNNAYTGKGGYQDKMNSASDDYLKQQENQSKDSKAVYTNTIIPKLQGVMEDAQKNAAGAMTLQEAGDPNNSVATGVRKMYGDQAQGVNQQGLADAGVLQAMGSQATAGQFAGAGGLMTGGQLQALQGANLGQSGAAMARAQQRANDLRQQGIQAGFDQSAAQYGRGQDAKGFYNQSIGNYQNANTAMQSDQDRYAGNRFGTQMGQANANLGIGTGLAGLRYGLDSQGQNRQISAINDKYGMQNGNLTNQMQQQAARDSATMGAGGTIVGAMVGGAGGAAAGKKLTQDQGPGAGNGGVGYETPQSSTPYAGANPYSGGQQEPTDYSKMGSGYASQNPYAAR